MTISSPPYWNVKDYGFSGQIGFGQAYEEYLSDIEKVFHCVYAATKPSGSLWLVTDTFKQSGELRLLPFDISARLRKVGWILQDIIIWQKDRTLPWSHQGKLRNIFEYVTFYSKSRRFKYRVAEVRGVNDLKDYWVRYPERYSPEGKAPSRMWSLPIPRQGSWGKAANYVRHACPLPPELIERILRLTTDRGDTVLDPFAGSGTVLATAKAMERKYIGTDLNRSYRRMFETEVLPVVLARHKDKSSGDRQQAVVQHKFASAIRDLRCLKYPREFVRLYRGRFGRLSVSAVVVLPSADRDRLTMVFCVANGRRIPKAFDQRAAQLMSNRPLSKFGLTAQFIVADCSYSWRNVLREYRLRPKQTMYLYRNGRFFHTSEHRSVRSVLHRETDLFSNEPTERYPRIVSTIGVNISPAEAEEFFESYARN